MMQICPSCGKPAEIRVIDSRPTASIQLGGTRFPAPCCTRRFKECQACGSHFSTYELTAPQLEVLIRRNRLMQNILDELSEESEHVESET